MRTVTSLLAGAAMAGFLALATAAQAAPLPGTTAAGTAVAASSLVEPVHLRHKRTVTVVVGKKTWHKRRVIVDAYDGTNVYVSVYPGVRVRVLRPGVNVGVWVGW